MNGIHDLGGCTALARSLPRKTSPISIMSGNAGYFLCSPRCSSADTLTSMNFATPSNVWRRPNICSQVTTSTGCMHSKRCCWQRGRSPLKNCGWREACPCKPGTPVLTQEMVSMVVSTGGSARVSHDVAPRFRVGDWVRTKNFNPTTHTRLPRYARDKVGRIEIAHGVFITPDTAAHGLGEHPQHVYSVSFTAQALWGEPRPDKVFIDLWDDYLEEA